MEVSQASDPAKSEGSAPRRSFRSFSILVIAWLVGLALGILFWRLVYPRSTLPAWQLAVLPAGVFGAVIGLTARRLSLTLIVSIAFAATYLAYFGDHQAFVTSLQRQLLQPKANADLEFSQMVGEASRKMQGANATKPANEKTASEVFIPTVKPTSATTFEQLSQFFGFELWDLYWPNLRSRAITFGLGMGLAFCGALQAARMTFQWQNRPIVGIA